RPEASPPRDGLPAPAQAAAVVRGRVTAADTGRPPRRAFIYLRSRGMERESRSTSTDADGRYEISELPAGRYSLEVTRGGYLSLRYGQRRPLEQGKPLQIADREVVEHVDFALPRMGVITGRVFDELGEPIEGV